MSVSLNAGHLQHYRRYLVAFPWLRAFASLSSHLITINACQKCNSLPVLFSVALLTPPCVRPKSAASTTPSCLCVARALARVIYSTAIILNATPRCKWPAHTHDALTRDVTRNRSLHTSLRHQNNSDMQPCLYVTAAVVTQPRRWAMGARHPQARSIG